jgi:uncharacterized protein (UPF0332 family)
MEAKLSPEFESCLKSGKIRRFSPGPTFTAGELAASGQDLSEARRTLTAGGLKWATIQAYYSMFHSARALLYAKGYRERSHRCLVVGLRELYVAPRLLGLEFIEGLEAGKMLRENADYYSRFSEAGARQTVELAEAFLGCARTLTAAATGQK